MLQKTNRVPSKDRLNGPLAPNTASTAELMHRPPRFVIYGSVVAGATDLAVVIRSELQAKGILDEGVVVNKDVAEIEDAFFQRGRYERSADETPSDDRELSAAKKLLKKIGGLSTRGLVKTQSDEIAVQAHDVIPDDESAPNGVFVFPNMRQYSENGVVGMTIDTPYSRIEELCTQHGVPMIRVERTSTPAELVQGIAEITT